MNFQRAASSAKIKIDFETIAEECVTERDQFSEGSHQCIMVEAIDFEKKSRAAKQQEEAPLQKKAPWSTLIMVD